ncbi:hypothetical protein niasHT_002447 [Heterodera trifolii]|uniref:C2H2-type domain-containing protein n=1 Tax=Heterodera trifolii TaxID=157864 RepID=A0ABD2LPX3_9BILA
MVEKRKEEKWMRIKKRKEEKLVEDNEKEKGRGEIEENEEEKEWKRRNLPENEEELFGQCHHRHVHTGKKKFLCDVCGMSFTQAPSLRNHRQLHTETKAFVCVCGHTFKAARNLASQRKRCKKLFN